MNKLLEDFKPLECSPLLVEGFIPEAGKEKHFYIRGKFATIEAQNNNGRFYPRHLWEREVARYQNEIKNGTVNTLMEWDHPEDRLEVDPKNAVAKITKLWIEGNYVMGEAVIFDNAQADTLKSMIKYGVKLSVSSRASGRTDASGVVQEFQLVTFDFVANPSDQSAYMQGIYENDQSKTRNNKMEESLLENLVNMVRNKDTEIEDLQAEIEELRRRNEEELEDQDYTMRRARYGQADTHDHLDVELLSDTDPANNYYSGEEEEPRISRLRRNRGRTRHVGWDLDFDHDTGYDLDGLPASVEEDPRFYRTGYQDLYDRDARRNDTLTESFSTRVSNVVKVSGIDRSEVLRAVKAVSPGNFSRLTESEIFQAVNDYKVLNEPEPELFRRRRNPTFRDQRISSRPLIEDYPDDFEDEDFEDFEDDIQDLDYLDDVQSNDIFEEDLDDFDNFEDEDLDFEDDLEDLDDLDEDYDIQSDDFEDFEDDELEDYLDSQDDLDDFEDLDLDLDDFEDDILNEKTQDNRFLAVPAHLL